MYEKSTEINNFRRMLSQTAASAGLQIISGLTDDKCCQLLAYLLVFGGSNEQFTTDGKLVSAIFYAQARLNLYGSERVNFDLLPVLQGYIKSIPNAESNPDYDNPPEWCIELEKEFGIKTYRRNK